MKIAIMILVLGLMNVTVAFAQQNRAQKMQQFRSMMQDSTMRSMIMDHMLENGDMRAEMMSRMMNHSNKRGAAMMGNMNAMMSDPEMKEQMIQHMSLMQSMIDGKMDRDGMQEMMKNSPKMKMHMQCLQMMNNGAGMRSDSTGHHNMMHRN